MAGRLTPSKGLLPGQRQPLFRVNLRARSCFLCQYTRDWKTKVLSMLARESANLLELRQEVGNAEITDKLVLPLLRPDPWASQRQCESGNLM